MALLGITDGRYQSFVQQMQAEGVDPHEVFWTVAPRDALYRVVSHGVPNRFSHWTFGREYLRLSQSGGRIYEFVIWDHPAEAYIDQTLSTPEAELIVAHVLGHAAVFRSNQRFQSGMLDRTEWDAHAHWVDTESERMTQEVQEYAQRFGSRRSSNPFQRITNNVVEIYPMPELLMTYTALDLLLTLEWATLAPWERQPPWEIGPVAELPTLSRESVTWRLWQGHPVENPREVADTDPALTRMNRKQWDQVDVVDVLRTQSRSPLVRKAARWLRTEWDYFWRIKTTKLLNEGYASYWHRRQTKQPLTELRAWEQVFFRTSVEVPSPMNPYWVGAELFQMLEDDGEDPHQWMRQWDDVSFLSMALTPQRIERLRVIPIVVDQQDQHPEGWAIYHERTNLETVADRMVSWQNTMAHGGVGVPFLRWTGPRSCVVAGFWGSDLWPQKKVTLDPFWFIGLATLLGRSIEVLVDPSLGAQWHVDPAWDAQQERR